MTKNIIPLANMNAAAQASFRGLHPELLEKISKEKKENVQRQVAEVKCYEDIPINPETSLNVASLVRLLKSKGIDSSRQYIYGICTGRLTPSYEFANKLCETLGIKIQTAFDMGEFHFGFKTADKIEETNNA